MTVTEGLRAQEAERSRDADGRRATEERMRIARELHDVLAHDISVINVRPGIDHSVKDRR
ncbi:histidine kinase [Actinomadura sp. 9N407]|uniref:histidine kinase n=1 Tax=Actinomadura sp. 9N407 TaxID=3375154 RepID=UPI00378A88C9